MVQLNLFEEQDRRLDKITFLVDKIMYKIFDYKYLYRILVASEASPDILDSCMDIICCWTGLGKKLSELYDLEYSESFWDAKIRFEPISSPPEPRSPQDLSDILLRSKVSSNSLLLDLERNIDKRYDLIDPNPFDLIEFIRNELLELQTLQKSYNQG